MKKFIVLALIFVLTATVFAGCRRNPATTDTGTAASTVATTHATTLPHTTTTHPAGATTVPHGSGILPDMTDNAPSSGYGRREMPPRY